MAESKRSWLAVRKAAGIPNALAAPMQDQKMTLGPIDQKIILGPFAVYQDHQEKIGMPIARAAKPLAK